MRWCEPTRFRAHWCWKGWSVDVHCNGRKTTKSCCSVCLEGAASFNPSASSNNSTALSSNFKLGLKRLRSFQQLFKNIQKPNLNARLQCQNAPRMHQASPSRETCFMYLYDSLCIFMSYDVTLRLEMLIDWPWPTCRGASKPNWRQHCTNCLEKPTPIFELSHVHTNDY